MSDSSSAANLQNKLIMLLIAILLSLGGWIGNSAYQSVHAMNSAVIQIDKRMISVEHTMARKDDIFETLTQLTLKVQKQEDKIFNLLEEINEEHRLERRERNKPYGSD